jgi:tetratricopeptide (TPR) repeat protein
MAESGTEEEFNRVIGRWERENPRPEVWVWFKRPTPERLTAPDEQMQRVLQFQNRIRKTTLYQEFDSEGAFQDTLEIALADWIQERATHRPELNRPPVNQLQATDLTILMSLVGPIPGEATGPVPVPLADERVSALKRLQAAGVIVDQDQPDIQPDLKTFLFVSSRLLSTARAREYLSSRYYIEGLSNFLPTILRERHHVILEDEALLELTVLLRISPNAAMVVFFGDTTKYDNLFAQVRDLPLMQAQHRRLAGEVLNQEAYVATVQDIQRGRTTTHFAGQLLTVKVVAMKIAAASLEGVAFNLQHTFPTAIIRGGSATREGELVFGTAELHARIGRGFLQMEEYRLARQHFDEVLVGNLTDDIRSEALNDRGLTRLRLDDIHGAIEDFRAALTINPRLDAANQNLADALLRLDNPRHEH